ncbi:MAG: BspA family leucine-rich repeat surface protein [Bacteroidales bacterium]|nr:BspA family leucine-rich repeat surface protein [Lachnoclostridium sp.]MCM1383895.1 BspA family leucine-rich repeat surface protein [Lachnoclostridium sp.]MCM1464452.1 BspA family leucine-rich repeat surface protein [Bacteroidales bacterium]
MKKGYDIFISYRRNGGESTAKTLFDTLSRKGYRVFFDVESLRSGDFNQKLYSVIDECKDFILVLSPDALERCSNEADWVRLEIEHALERGRNIIPIMLRGFEFPKELPPSIEAVRYKNGLQANYDFFDAFIDKLQTFLLSKPQKLNMNKLLPGCGIALGAAALVIAVAVWLGRGAEKEPMPAPAAGSVESSGEVLPSQGGEADSQMGEADSQQEKVYEYFLMEDTMAIPLVDEYYIGYRGVLGNEEVERSSIVAITFLDTLKDAPEDAWNVCDGQAEYIKAWVEPDGETQAGTPGYHLYIASRGYVVAKSCEALFANYYNLTEINFNHRFRTDGVDSMESMFENCYHLTDLDLNDFHTDAVKDMERMFANCQSLESLELGSFDTEQVEDMRSMFDGCSTLAQMDVSGFNTANVVTMAFMFCGCEKLQEINVSEWDTGKVINMEGMFCNCEGLRSLDLSGWDISSVKHQQKMFYNCPKLELKR